MSADCRNDAALAAAFMQNELEMQETRVISSADAGKEHGPTRPRLCKNACGRLTADGGNCYTCCRTCRKGSLVHGPVSNKQHFGDVDPPPECVLEQDQWMPKEGEEVKICQNPGCGRRVPTHSSRARFCCHTCGAHHPHHGKWCNSNHFGKDQTVPLASEALPINFLDLRIGNQGCGRPAQPVDGLRRCCRLCNSKRRCAEHSETCMGPAEEVVIEIKPAPRNRSPPSEPLPAEPSPGLAEQPAKSNVSQLLHC